MTIGRQFQPWKGDFKMCWRVKNTCHVISAPRQVANFYVMSKSAKHGDIQIRNVNLASLQELLPSPGVQMD